MGRARADLRDEVRRGHLDHHSTTRRYALNGIDPAVRDALLRIGLVDER